MSQICTECLPLPTHPQFIDLTGHISHKLTVLGYVGTDTSSNSLWLCRCQCGNLVNRPSNPLRTGRTFSCGCQRNTHQQTKHPLYDIWNGMMKRCYNPKSDSYRKYGARDIRVCERWHTFDNFVADMSPRPERLTLERKDNNGDYTPENCVWDTWKVQANNRRNSKLVTIDGVTRTVQQWADHLGISNANYIYHRLRLGWEPVDAVMLPTDITHKYQRSNTQL